jgi:hypothetical protein
VDSRSWLRGLLIARSAVFAVSLPSFVCARGRALGLRTHPDHSQTAVASSSTHAGHRAVRNCSHAAPTLQGSIPAKGAII